MDRLPGGDAHDGVVPAAGAARDPQQGHARDFDADVYQLHRGRRLLDRLRLRTGFLADDRVQPGHARARGNDPRLETALRLRRMPTVAPSWRLAAVKC